MTVPRRIAHLDPTQVKRNHLSYVMYVVTLLLYTLTQINTIDKSIVLRSYKNCMFRFVCDPDVAYATAVTISYDTSANFNQAHVAIIQQLLICQDKT